MPLPGEFAHAPKEATVMRNPNAILSGGPAPDLKEEERVRYVEDATEKVKLLYGNRYEHFVPTETTVVERGLELKVFAWSGYTCVAE
jgi:hypothetical protein